MKSFNYKVQHINCCATCAYYDDHNAVDDPYCGWPMCLAAPANDNYVTPTGICDCYEDSEELRGT